MATRRRFGRVRKLPSGRWQARYSTPDGCDHPAPGTFTTKTAADRWLAAVETDMARGQWVDPRSRQLLLSDYADSWLPARADLKIRTRELYRWLLDKYVLPQLGHLPLDQVTPTVVRAWHATVSRAGLPTPTRQAYALLRAILNTAVADELLTRNPCTVRGAGVARSAERSVATLAQIQALAEAVPARYRMFILLAAWSGARWGELVAPSHDRLDLDRGTMTIDRQYVELMDHSLALDRRPLTRGGFRTTWVTAREHVGLPDFRFHDLRHTGNTLAAATGASTKELMARLGHASMRAALIYQHATADRDAAIAAALSRLATGQDADAESEGHPGPPLHAQGRARPRASGTRRARKGRPPTG